jgi:hypothetical protein
VIVQRKADPRLARLAASRQDDVEEVRNRHREIRTAEIVHRRVEEERRGGGDGQQQDSQEESAEEEEDDAAGKDQRRSATAAAHDEDEGEADKKRQAVRER